MKGSTLIETLIYIGLLGILMVGIFSSVYMIIYSQEKMNNLQKSDSSLLIKKYHE